jgi:hypothetical protein
MSTPQRIPNAATQLKNYAVSGVEPALSEVLDDPIVHLVMARDGVTRGNLELLVEQVRRDRLDGQGQIQRLYRQGLLLLLIRVSRGFRGCARSLRQR